MLPIYTSEKIKEWDNFTIEHSNISSLELMERASMSCVIWITKNISTQTPIYIICGNGNNGGDGLNIARLLIHSNFTIKTFYEPLVDKSVDNSINLEKLQVFGFTELIPINNFITFELDENAVVIDCIFGIGLNKPVEGLWKNVISCINNSKCKIISIDIPSGLCSEPYENFNVDDTTIVKANYTLTFQTPKLSMLIPGWGEYCGRLVVIDIGLNKEFISQNVSDNYWLDISSIKKIFKVRDIFSHKGTYGHALLISGNPFQCGAAILSSKACIKTGAGLVSVNTSSECGVPVVISNPEVMIEQLDITNINLSPYTAIGIGPGMGTSEKESILLSTILQNATVPLVLDADALTILSRKKEGFTLPKNCIFTPHPKEFDRLVGASYNAFERLKKAKKLAIEHQCIVILKGAYTAICSWDAKVYFNSTGNPGMATAGSGDVLTGILTGLLAQQYQPLEAAILGVFIHGKAGDEAAIQNSMTGLIASDIIAKLSSVYNELEN